MNMVPLGEICEFKYGKSLPKKVREVGPFRVFGSNGQVDEHSEAYTDGPTIIVGRKGSIGEVAFSDGPCWPIDTTYYVDSTATAQDPRWLFYALKSLRLQELNKSAAIPGLNRNDAYAKKIPLPPLEEQKRIAGMLDQADALRRLRTRALDKLNTLGQAIFHEMFEKSATPLPNARLGDVCDVRDGTHDSPKYVDVGFPLLTSKNFSSGRISFDAANMISKEDYDKINKRSKVDCGDIVMPMIGTIGSPVIIEEEPNFAIKNVALIKFEATSPRASFINALLSGKYLEKVIKQQGRGGTQKFLSLGDLRKLKFPLPGIEDQETFDRRNASIQREISKHTEAVSLQKTLFASLQHRAFRGEL